MTTDPGNDLQVRARDAVAAAVAGDPPPPQGAPPVLEKLVRLARRLDDLPVSPAGMGKLAGRALHQVRQRRASNDPQWADIQARRQMPGRRGFLTFLSDDLTLDDWHTQERIEAAQLPQWPDKVASRLRQISLAEGAAALRDRAERARRGWAANDVWNLNSTHAKMLGQMLLHLAEHAHGWPGTEEFPTYEDWQEALRYHGRVLVHTSTGCSAAADSLDEWHMILQRDGHHSPSERAAFDYQTAVDVAADELQRTSLQWVVDHYPHLWD